MIHVEICIDCDDIQSMERSVSGAREGGAHGLELCASMEWGGLTPSVDAVRRSRALFAYPHIMAMIRPRKGGFCYTPQELATMEEQIRGMKHAGADGVVFGALTPQGIVDEEGLARLVDTARKEGLQTTFHRAFDALKDPLEGLEILGRHRVDRVLTSGIPWEGAFPAMERMEWLQRVAENNRGRLNLVLGGGVAPENVVELVSSVEAKGPVAWVHAFSGVLENGVTSASRVALLEGKVNPTK